MPCSHHRTMLPRARLSAILTLVASTVLACGEPSGPGSSDRVVWKVPGGSVAAPATSNGSVYFLTVNHALLALDAGTGAKRWESIAGSGTGFPRGKNLLIVGENVIVPDEAVYAFDRATGARGWVFQPASGDMPGRFLIASDGARVYTGSPAGFAYALDPATGSAIWTTELASDNNTVVYSPAVDGGLVVVTLRHFTNPTTGGVVALDAVTGAIRWQRNFVPTGPGQGSGSYGRVAL